jgi:hypothetical protein
MFRYLLAFCVLLYGVTRYAPLLDSLSPAVGTTVLGFAVGVFAGLLFTYRLGWNGRGDEDERQAVEGVRKKNQAGKI